MNVAENLYEFLKHNDCAEIPGLGTFSVKTSSAQINDMTGTIVPPQRKVVFDKQCTGNKDFISFMSRNEFISLQTAETWIKQYSDFIIGKLEKGETVKLDKLGSMKKAYLGEYLFQAEENLNLMEDSFALGELKNVKTYENNTVTDPAKLRLSVNDEAKEEMNSDFAPVDNAEDESANAHEDMAERIASSESLDESNRINETEQQTEERIALHNETEVKSDVEKPVDITAEKESVNVDFHSVAEEDKSQSETATEQTEENTQEQNGITADAEEQNAEQDEEESIDDLQKEVMDILNKYDDGQEAKKKKNKKKRKFWLILFWIVIVLLLLCCALVGCHYFGLLKDIKFMKPLTDKLSYYIPVREPKKEKPASTLTVTSEQQENEPTEVSPTEVLQEEILNHESVNAAPVKKAVQPANKKAEPKKDEPQQESAPKPVEDNSPVLVQTYSKLGFDVIGGTYDTRQKAEGQARKAKSLGYDGYVLSKIKNGNPVYYVSYGSRRTMKEATDLMQSMINKMGGSYTIISR
ncbi:MAG: SPOR domain-containing protein [Bacteroidales bacterium]|nr:SPOR domain-containing protein [Bacteroidales bacterium]